MNIRTMASEARAASETLATLSLETRNAALLAIAEESDIALLIAFFNTDEYARVGEAETDRLHRQLHAMQQYSAVLGERMAALTAVPPA